VILRIIRAICAGLSLSMGMIVLVMEGIRADRLYGEHLQNQSMSGFWIGFLCVALGLWIYGRNDDD
jgi:hypothetical protein